MDCFNAFCDSIYRISYKVGASQQIDYPTIAVHYGYYMPSIAFFDNSYALMLMSCEYQPVPWNCTDLVYNHPTTALYVSNHSQTSSMQISMAVNQYYYQRSLLLFSMVQGQNAFNGSEFINCENTACTM